MNVLRYVLIGLLLVACASEQQPDADATATSDGDAAVKTFAVQDSALQRDEAELSAYDFVLERVKARGYSDDFRRLRAEYVKTRFYHPYDSIEREQMQQMYEAIDDNQLQRCVALATRILDRNFVSLPAHRAAAICYEQIGDDVKQQFHESMYRGLLDAIAQSGNGKSPESAFVVINADEIDAVLLSQDLEVVRQDLIERNGREYNRIFVQNPQTWRKFDVFFDVSTEKRWYIEHLQSR